MGVIIGTAGHIDHGKTSLVKALTGQDTDRLKEEKERGISIDLGFAYLDLPDGSRAGIVDVPGHERFIRNMLAGAHGIDMALFTVAADDGVMPQTEEHFDIVHLLRVPRLLFAMTKVDLVGAERRREVEAQIAALVAGSPLEGSPVLPCSSVTGEGLDELRARIAAIALEVHQRAAIGWFRLPVDRVFVLQGHGVVVTGTAIGGRVRVGDRVRCLPGEELFRVRSLHVHNAAVQVASAGQRVALNLGGAERPELTRGDVICDEALTRISGRFDAAIEVRPAAGGAGLKERQRVRVHVGTAERLATVRMLGSTDKLKPRERGYCQFVLARPVHLLRGDRFILRDETASRTIGGGVVVAPWARQHKRSETDVLSTLEALDSGDPAAAAAAYLESAEELAVPLTELAQFLNVQTAETAALADRIEGLRVFDVDGSRLYVTAARFQDACRELVATLRDFHVAHPLSPGMEAETARQGLTVRLFRALVDRAAAEGIVVREGSVIRLPEHKVTLTGDQQALVARIQALMARDPAAPPAAAEMEAPLGVPRARVVEVLRVMERQRLIVRVGVDLYFLPDYVARAEALLRQKWRPGEEITPAAFRDAIGTSRKFAIPLLEYFDRVGVTDRNATGRRLKHSGKAVSRSG
ncbi:MAG TPA: selenocysteine-specific translation elongation factor [Vicinamibacterales bacterium]